VARARLATGCLIEPTRDDCLAARNRCTASSVRRPTIPARKVVPWEPATVLAVREALPERYRVIAMLGAGLGLR
jgi:hypothetical protein